MFTEAMMLDICAQMSHEANRVWCEAHGDNSQPYWIGAPDWQKESAREGVRFALAGFSPQQLHEEWCRKKIADGWSYGPTKIVESKLHPCLVPYHELPPVQRAKDYIFGSVITTTADALCKVHPEAMNIWQMLTHNVAQELAARQ